MPKQSRDTHRRPRKISLLTWWLGLLLLLSLACTLIGREQSVSSVRRTRTPLPTFTPTVAVALLSETQSEPGVAAPAQEAPVEAPAQTVAEPQPEPPAAPAQAPAAGPQPIPLAELTRVPPPSNPEVIPTRTRLPTFTPTLAAGASPQPESSATPTLPPPPASSTETPSSSPSPTPEPTLRPGQPNPTEPPPTRPPIDTPTPPPPAIKGWSFIGVHSQIDQGGAVVVGELINNTGIPQTEVHVSGTFYDRHDEVIEDEIDTLEFVPVEIVPVGAHVPFELVVESSTPIYRIDLAGNSEPTADSPRQNFAFSNVNKWTDAVGLYCLDGKIQNSGPPLEEFLTILVMAYNNRGQMVSFGEYSVAAPEIVVDDQSSLFEICIDPLDQPIVYHELRALGL